MPTLRSNIFALAAFSALGIGIAHPATAAPIITNLKMTPTTLTVTGGTVTVTATVTDTVPIASVSGYVTANGSRDSGVTVAMSNGGSGTTYTGVFQVTHYNTTAAPYSFNLTLTAKDATATQTATAAVLVAQANDSAPPAISAIALTPATLTVTGGQLLVKATVIDPGKRPITEVKALISRNGGTYISGIALSNGGSGSVYSASFNSSVNNTSNTPYTYSASVTAYNDLGLSFTAYGGSAVQANANTPPIITKAVVSPATLPTNGGVATVAAVVSDPNGRLITSVTSKLIASGQTYNLTLTNGGSGNIYTSTVQFGTNNAGWVFSGTVTAYDDLGLNNSANINGVQAFMPGTLPELVAPSATALAVSPASIAKGSANLTLALNGINFQSNSTVLFNGKKLTPTNISPTAIIVVVPAAMLTTAGAYEISVVNPAPGGVSNGIAFNVF